MSTLDDRMRLMKIFLGADHGGYAMKEQIKNWFKGLGQEVVDIGALSLDSADDYVDYGTKVAREIRRDPNNRGLLFCRNGMGMIIAANRIAGVRCGLAFDIDAVRRARTDDDINCLSMPADYLETEKAKEMIEVFLKTEKSTEERYERRLKKLATIN